MSSKQIKGCFKHIIVSEDDINAETGLIEAKAKRCFGSGVYGDEINCVLSPVQKSNNNSLLIPKGAILPEGLIDLFFIHPRLLERLKLKVNFAVPLDYAFPAGKVRDPLTRDEIDLSKEEHHDCSLALGIKIPVG